MSKCFSILLLLGNYCLFGQNLISNGSFETLSACKVGQDSVNYAIGWYDPTNSSPDLYNSCRGINNFSVPINFGGIQEAENGNGYVGLYTYANQTQSTINGREYVQKQLDDTLVSCNVYQVEFYVSLLDNAHFAINSLGAHLSDIAITRNDWMCLSDYEPQINNPRSRILSDKENWIKIEGKFVSNGDEQYITLGNFHLDHEIDTFPTDNNYLFGYSYYYLDNVSLTQISDETVTAYAGNDTTIYLGDSVFIGQDIYNLNCTWTVLETGETIADSTSGLYVSPTDTITYVVEQDLCGVKTYDTVTINVKINDVGMQDLIDYQDEIVVYPNPSNGNFIIKVDVLNEIKITDLGGRLIDFEFVKVDLNAYNVKLKVSSGIYNVQIINDNQVKNVKLTINE